MCKVVKLKGKEIRNFFEVHSHNSAYNKDPSYYIPIINWLTYTGKKEFKVLDIGCGDGSFLRGLGNRGIKGGLTGVDLSFNLVSQKRMGSDHGMLNLMVADAFKLPFNSETKFDLIHLDSVLHHLIGNTISGSTKLAIRLLDLLTSMLSEEGLLIVEEMYYDSRLIPSLTASIIFYSLKLIKVLNIDLTRLRRDIIPGLEVNFFHTGKLEKMLFRYGEVKEILREKSNISRLEKMLLLHDRGHISHIVKKRSNSP